MSVFRKAVDRLTDLLRNDSRVTYRASIDARLAPYITPLLDRLAADDQDGDTLRGSLFPWFQAERPPVAIYNGTTSTVRIDGPWQVASRHYFPLGGLILSPSLTAHLDPFEAQALHQRMLRAIEDATLAWVREKDLYALPPVPAEIDRTVADPAAKALIRAWAYGTDAQDTDGRSETASDSPRSAGRKGAAHD